MTSHGPDAKSEQIQALWIVWERGRWSSACWTAVAFFHNREHCR